VSRPQLDHTRLRLLVSDAKGEPDVLTSVWSSLGEARTLLPAHVLFLESEPASHIYLVAEGRVEAVHLSPDGRKFVSFEARVGDILGEASLAAGANYTSCAEAASRAHVFRLRGETVSALLREGGDFAAVFASALARRLGQTEERAGQVALHGLECRVARVLIDESEAGAKVIQLTHQEIAERAGAARESVTQTLNRFKRQGLLDLTRRAISVQAVNRLVAISRHEPASAWWPFFKLFPAICASALMCAELVLQGPTFI